MVGAKWDSTTDTNDSTVKTMIWIIRNYIGTWCAFGSGAPFPWDMIDAYKYVRDRGLAWVMKANYNSFGISTSGLRKTARDTIRYHKTPVIIGTGRLSHYPLAYGYAWRKRTVCKCFIVCWNETQYSRWFKVNQGWGTAPFEWVSASTLFAGRFYSNV